MFDYHYIIIYNYYNSHWLWFKYDGYCVINVQVIMDYQNYNSHEESPEKKSDCDYLGVIRSNNY